MQAILRGIRLLVLGGDRREMVMVRCLADLGCHIYTVGHRPYDGYPSIVGVEDLRMYPDALPEIDVVIAPMSHTDALGRVRDVPDKDAVIIIDDELCEKFPPKVPLFIGMAQPIIKKLAERHCLQLIETANIDEIAILNSIPTAEGAVQIAMEELPITIHDSRVLVLGMGRCGLTLARMLAGLGAKVCVIDRSLAHLARAKEMGLDAADVSELGNRVETADVIFNTIPAQLITKRILYGMNKETLIVDIASAPGGVDFAAARELGIRAVLAAGLPGRVAPVTAGRILGRCMPQIILKALAKPIPARS